MDRAKGADWRTPAAILLASAMLAGVVMWSAGEARRSASRTEAAIERVETELRWARTARSR